MSWSLSLIGLLIALLMALPCAGSARAAAPAHRGGSGQVAASAADAVAPAVPAPAVPGAVAPAEKAWCASDAPLPGPGHGCSSNPWCAEQSQLPNAPPQPGAAALPVLVPPSPAPVRVPLAAVDWPAPTPDLHLLQVNRP
ncbi:hypothetical protein ACFYNO_01750 [Kitasatospora sp. NPDC006697]|uniref:hypothetical protein n=1 Tax=Kitasatospora sp. NPDC006697 TaxID=3364020 RepID=UPI003693078D